MGSVLLAAVFIALQFAIAKANPDSKRLYDDLLSNYNRLIRPVGNNSDRLTVKMGLRLSQLIDVNLKNQIMTTNVWVEQEWNDYKLKWNPDDYGGVDTLHVPSEHIWLPDIVLYNNADGNYEVTIMTKAILHHTGKVVWTPPSIYECCRSNLRYHGAFLYSFTLKDQFQFKSSVKQYENAFLKSFCEIDVEYFPFDEQTCLMKFGSWTYDGYMIDLRHLLQSPDSDVIDIGIDLQDYYISVEWEILKVPAVRNEKFYSCCEEPYPDIIFNITIRRKTLFYTVNLIIPCVGISMLSVLVFYLPSDSGEKISLCISILLSLTVFFLLLVEIIPPTSLTVPLLGKYLLFTMMLVTLSVCTTIAVLNVNFRSPVTHKMAPWVQRIFIEFLPKLLCIQRPKKEDEPQEVEEQPPEVLTDVFHVPPDVEKYSPFCTNKYSTDFDIPALPPSRFGEPPLPALPLPLSSGEEELFSPGINDMSPNCCGDVSPTFEKPTYREMEKTMEASRFVAQHVKNKDKFESVEEDWKYVALVLDRLFLWIFAIACVVGTCLIILQAPSLYDTTNPIDIQYSKIAKKKLELLKMGSTGV